MILNSTTSVLKISTAQATPISVMIDYVDYTANTTLPSLGQINSQRTNITTATTTIVLSAPSSTNISRQVLKITIHNTSTSSSNTVIVNIDDNGQIYKEYDCVVGLDETVYYNKEGGWKKYNNQGVQYAVPLESAIPLKSYSIPISKSSVGAAEAAGIFHYLGTGGGIVPAWAIGTSGLAGRAVLNSETGFIKIPSTSNKIILKENNLLNSIAGTPIYLVDTLFVNNGIVVTTTTAQTLNTVALPTRDRDQSANGINCIWGLLVTTATTNASAVTTITGSYTDQDGNAGNTATIANFPATCTVGSFIPFVLASPNTGARTFETITLGTTLTAGAVSLVCLRLIDGIQTLGANLGAYNSQKNVLLYGNEALTIMIMAVGTSAYTIQPSTILINEY